MEFFSAASVTSLREGMNGYEIMADLSLLAHAAYSMFVVLGLMMILIGMVLLEKPMIYVQNNIAFCLKL